MAQYEAIRCEEGGWTVGRDGKSLRRSFYASDSGEEGRAVAEAMARHYSELAAWWEANGEDLNAGRPVPAQPTHPFGGDILSRTPEIPVTPTDGGAAFA